MRWQYWAAIVFAASMVVLVAPLLLLLTAPRGSRRPTTVGWWSAGVALGSLWWLLPLLVTKGPTDLVFTADMAGTYEVESHVTDAVWINLFVK